MKTITELLEAVSKAGVEIVISPKGETVDVSIKSAVINPVLGKVVIGNIKRIIPSHLKETYPEINELIEGHKQREALEINYKH